MPDAYRFKKNKREFARFLNTRFFMGNRLIKVDELTLRSESYMDFMKAEGIIRSKQMEEDLSYFKPYAYETEEFVFVVFPVKDPSDEFAKCMINFYRELESIYQYRRCESDRSIFFIVLADCSSADQPEMPLGDMVRTIDKLQDIGLPRIDAYEMLNLSVKNMELMDDYYNQLEKT